MMRYTPAAQFYLYYLSFLDSTDFVMLFLSPFDRFVIEATDRIHSFGT